LSEIRAIIYGTGKVNLLAARLMTEKGVRIVGAINRAGPKIGQDIGELAGLDAPLGVLVSSHPEEVLATPADIVLVGIYDDMERMFTMFQRCLEHGHNVLSVGAHHSYPWRMAPQLTQQLDTLAKARGVTISASGNQDFFIVNLGSMMTGVCQRVETLTFRSLTDINSFGPEVADIAAVGQSLADFEANADNQSPSIYTTLIENVAADLELDVIDVTQTVEAVTWHQPLACQSLKCTIEPGHLIGILQRLKLTTAQAITLHAEAALRIRVNDEEEEFKEWVVKGEPSYKIRATELDSGFTTASQCVNRLAHVIQARPGYVTLEKLPKLKFRSRLSL
jgi:hypothetical protein